MVRSVSSLSVPGGTWSEPTSLLSPSARRTAPRRAGHAKDPSAIAALMAPIGAQANVQATLCRLQQARRRRLTDREQVAQVAAAVPGAHRRTRTPDRPARPRRRSGPPRSCSAPGAGQRRAVATEPGRQDAVELVDAEGDGLDERRRVADAHQVARAIGRQLGESPRRAPGSISSRRLPHREPADAVAVEVQLDGAPRRWLARSAASVPPWTMPNSDWSSRRCARPARDAHAPVRSTASSHDVGRARQRRADVEHHLDVGAEQLLRGDRRLRGQPVRRAVVHAAERHAVVVDLRLEREHLEAAGVGQREAVPAGEGAEAAEPGDASAPGRSIRWYVLARTISTPRRS